jgi:hypothetical protein
MWDLPRYLQYMQKRDRNHSSGATRRSSQLLHALFEKGKRTKRQPDHSIQSCEGDCMRTKERLAQALQEAGADPLTIHAARRGRYDDFESDSATPISDLVREARRQGLVTIAIRAMSGEFDATAEEADEWFKSQPRYLPKRNT